MSTRTRAFRSQTTLAFPPVIAAANDQLQFPPLARFRFNLLAEDPIRMPEYPGSAWRGLLGHGLKRTACITRQPICQGCILAQQCVYSTLFETPASAVDVARGYTALPHPFVLAIDPTAPRQLAPGDSFNLTINLLGPAIQQVPYLIHALGLAGQRGFGRSGGRFTLTRVEREPSLGTDHWLSVYATETGVYQTQKDSVATPTTLPPEIRLKLITPLRIKRDGHFVGTRDLTAVDLVRTLYHRLRDLAKHYGGDPRRFDLRTLVHDPSELQLHRHWLRWHEWTRYSSRQDTLMQFGGLIGEIQLDGAALPELWPALWLGQWTHLGKGTAFGLGRYRVLSSLNEGTEAIASQACDTRS